MEEDVVISSREEFFAVDDSVVVKEVAVPATIPVWADKKFYIRCLSRGEQDAYSKRQMGDAKVRMGRKDQSGEMTASSMFGHDAYLVSLGACDKNGKRIFESKDIPAIDKKLGELVGWLAKEIVIFSGMVEDVAVASGDKSANQAVEEELKN